MKRCDPEIEELARKAREARKKREKDYVRIGEIKDPIIRRVNRYKGQILEWRKEGYSYRKIQRRLAQCHAKIDLQRLWATVKKWEKELGAGRG